MRGSFITAAGLIAVTIFVINTTAQRRPAKTAAPTPSPVAAAAPAPTPTPERKKNERPSATSSTQSAETKPVPVTGPTYHYTFERKGFIYPKIDIEHDSSGNGTITFEKDNFEEAITDPLKLTPAMLDELKAAFTSLNFLDSNESYQYSRDYQHLGNVTITLTDGSRSRTAKYNWTENKDAKFLMDEYRRVANEAIWKFEIGVARTNQPLQSPGLLQQLDEYIKRNEIADPPHLIPMLNELSMDERMPLMARNRAAKIIKDIEKSQAKPK